MQKVLHPLHRQKVQFLHWLAVASGWELHKGVAAGAYAAHNIPDIVDIVAPVVDAAVVAPP